MFYKLTSGGLIDAEGVSINCGSPTSIGRSNFTEEMDRKIKERVQQVDKYIEKIRNQETFLCRDTDIETIDYGLSLNFNYYNLTYLRKNGWTTGLVNKYLGAPSFLVHNRRNFKHPICCYTQERVEAAEADPAFQSDKAYKKQVSEKAQRTRQRSKCQ